MSNVTRRSTRAACYRNRHVEAYGQGREGERKVPSIQFWALGRTTQGDPPRSVELPVPALLRRIRLLPVRAVPAAAAVPCRALVLLAQE